MNNAITDYIKSLDQDHNLNKNLKITENTSKIMNELIETKRNLIFTKGFLWIVIMTFFIFILNENLVIFTIGVPIIIFFLLVDILQYKKYLNIRKKSIA